MRQDFAHQLWQGCSTAGQAFEMHLEECGFSSRAGLAQFSVQSRGVWLCLMGWHFLGPKITWLSPSSWPVYMCGAVCATQRHKLLLFKLTLWKILLSILSFTILPVSVKWPREYKSNWCWVGSTLPVKILRKAEIPGGCRQAGLNVSCLFWLC